MATIKNWLLRVFMATGIAVIALTFPIQPTYASDIPPYIMTEEEALSVAIQAAERAGLSRIAGIGDLPGARSSSIYRAIRDVQSKDPQAYQRFWQAHEYLLDKFAEWKGVTCVANPALCSGEEE
jgi:hypothetical protein